MENDGETSCRKSSKFLVSNLIDITGTKLCDWVGRLTGLFLFNNQPDALIIQIYSVIKLYMFQALSVPIIRSFPLYIQHW
jgi:hypothetical protein